MECDQSCTQLRLTFVQEDFLTYSKCCSNKWLHLAAVIWVAFQTVFAKFVIVNKWTENASNDPQFFKLPHSQPILACVMQGMLSCLLSSMAFAMFHRPPRKNWGSRLPHSACLAWPQSLVVKRGKQSVFSAFSANTVSVYCTLDHFLTLNLNLALDTTHTPPQVSFWRKLCSLSPSHVSSMVSFSLHLPICLIISHHLILPVLVTLFTPL